MEFVSFLFRATLWVWGVAIALGVIGSVIDSPVLTALAFALRRFAPALTVIWLVSALARLAWLRIWPVGRRQR